MPLDHYEWDDITFEALTRAGVPPFDVIALLYGGGPQTRRFVGDTTLVISGLTLDGHTLHVRLVERRDHDDTYVIRDAHIEER